MTIWLRVGSLYFFTLTQLPEANQNTYPFLGCESRTNRTLKHLNKTVMTAFMNFVKIISDMVLLIELLSGPLCEK